EVLEKWAACGELDRGASFEEKALELEAWMGTCGGKLPRQGGELAGEAALARFLNRQQQLCVRQQLGAERAGRLRQVPGIA
ncbi:unnamed protein product, partial [Polarella glacialis]